MKKKLIVLAGIPGIGKYTVGKELCKKVSNTIFLHNHLTINLAFELYPNNDIKRKKFLIELRKFIFSRALEQENVVATLSLGLKLKTEELYINLYKEVAKLTGAEIFYIYLSAKNVDYLKRVVDKEREKLQKLTNKESAQDIFDNHEKTFVLPKYWITVDTTGLSPNEIADIINNKI